MNGGSPCRTQPQTVEFDVHPNNLYSFGAIGDFSGPAESTSFPLGTIIPIKASVEQNTHQPLLLLLEECVAATTEELQPESNLYEIITNKG